VPMLVAAGVVGIVLGFAPGLDRRVRLTGAVGIVLLALYLRYTAHSVTSYPAVDWIRPRGMDVWPGLLQAAGMLMLLIFGPAILSGAASRVARLAGGLGIILAIGYWFFPGHFVIDELGPAVEGRATMPVVVQGRIEPRSWGRAGMPGTPISMLTEVLANEDRLASIAHGMGHEAARLAGNEGGGQLRATLWGVQRAATPLVLWAGVLSMAVGLVLLVGMVARFRLPRWTAWTVPTVIGVALLVPPVLNLALRGVGVLMGLPEAQDGAMVSSMLSASMIGCVLVAWAAGLAIVSHDGLEE